MTKRILAALLAILMTATFAACSKRTDESSVPPEDNPSSPEGSAAVPPPELSLPDPVSSQAPSAPEEESSEEEEPETSEDEEESAPSEPGRAALTATATLTVDVLDAAGVGTGAPQTLTMPFPGGWTLEGTIIMVNGGKVGEVTPCRRITDANDPFASLNLPAGYGVFEAGGSSAVTWSEEVNMWDEAAGKGVVMTVRHYYKAGGDLLYGMYFYLAYDGAKTISEVTAVEIFSGLG